MGACPIVIWEYGLIAKVGGLSGLSNGVEIIWKLKLEFSLAMVGEKSLDAIQPIGPSAVGTVKRISSTKRNDLRRYSTCSVSFVIEPLRRAQEAGYDMIEIHGHMVTRQMSLWSR